MCQLLTTLLICLLTLSACKKDKDEFILGANLTIVNAEVDLAGVKVDPGRNLVYATEPSLGYSSYRTYNLNRTPTQFKIVDAADTTKLLFNGKLDLRTGIYTLFLVGQAPFIDTIFHEETNFPFISQEKIYNTADSVVNVRFVNLSPDSVPLRIRISGATTNEVDNLALRGISNWIAYKATALSTNYVFQIRNASTDALITSYTFTANSTNRFKNVTLVIKGLQGTTTGTHAFGVMPVNYF